MFKNIQEAMSDTWQAFERNICRFLICKGYKNVRLVGQSNDHGADIIATTQTGKRCVVQSKHWKRPVGSSDVNYTLEAMRTYGADLPIVVSLNGYDASAYSRQKQMMTELNLPMQLWDSSKMVEMTKALPEHYSDPKFKLREYQEKSCEKIVSRYLSKTENRALVVLATGLGKTVVAAESVRRIRVHKSGCRVLVLAHTNPLVEQLERSFWKFISKNDTTIVWNSIERHTGSKLSSTEFTFACVDTVYNAIKDDVVLPRYEIIIVDECHHVGSELYNFVLSRLSAGEQSGPFLIGLTATPWRADDVSPRQWFGDPLVCVDMVEGLQKGFLTNVDYRMFTSNIDWSVFADPSLQDKPFSVKQLNKTIFINEWNDAIIERFMEAYEEQKPHSRAIVFCATIDHAKLMASKICSLGFCVAKALYSGGGKSAGMNNFKRNQILADFADGRINVICTVDIFNEGLDVPDVNLIVFNRTTHSRRIFIQQLGRGLRLSQDKDKVIVLDFVSDVRRIADGITLKKSLARPGSPRLLNINHKVRFCRSGGEEDPKQESFLKKWLEDIAELKKCIEDENGEDEAFLRFPPIADVL